jgi:hypothetical protein
MPMPPALTPISSCVTLRLLPPPVSVMRACLATTAVAGTQLPTLRAPLSIVVVRQSLVVNLPLPLLVRATPASVGFTGLPQ